MTEGTRYTHLSSERLRLASKLRLLTREFVYYSSSSALDTSMVGETEKICNGVVVRCFNWVMLLYLFYPGF